MIVVQNMREPLPPVGANESTKKTGGATSTNRVKGAPPRVRLLRDSAVNETPAATGYFVGVAGAGADVLGAGCAAVGGVAALVTGLITTPVTSPFTASFCFRLVVPRAARVALSFAVAAARCSVVSGLRALGGGKPKSASSCVAAPNVETT